MSCRMVFRSAGTVGDRSGGVVTGGDGVPLNRPDTGSAFGDTTTIRPKSFASVRIFPGAKSNVSPIFSSRAEGIALEASVRLNGGRQRRSHYLDRRLSTGDSGLS